MTGPTVRYYRKNPLEKIPTYIGQCCREWILAVGAPVGSCGLCGERPTYLRPDDEAHPLRPHRHHHGGGQVSRCRYASTGLPACLAGTRGQAWWCKACSDHALIRWLVEVVHYPFDFSFDTPPPVDHGAIADHWNIWDGWGISAEDARACVYEEAGLAPLPDAVTADKDETP